MNDVTYSQDHITLVKININSFSTKAKIMSEDNLKSNSVDDLIDLMVISVNELFALNKVKERHQAQIKTKEIQLIQKAIASKRPELVH